MKSREKKYCVEVVRMNPASIRLYERGEASKVRFDVLGSRCFSSKAKAETYRKRMERSRSGRARIYASASYK